MEAASRIVVRKEKLGVPSGSESRLSMFDQQESTELPMYGGNNMHEAEGMKVLGQKRKLK
jgi:hypothetical protein